MSILSCRDSRESSIFSLASVRGSSCTSVRTSSVVTESPEDPSVLKEKNKFYKSKKNRRENDEEQLIMFDPAVVKFSKWKARFERLVQLREIEEEEVKKDLLLKALPPATKALVPNLFRRHEEPFEKPADVILAKLADHYDKVERKDRIKRRIEFFSSVQGERNFYQFANDLKEQLFECDFAQFEEEALVTVFIMGLNNSVLRKHLLKDELWLTSLTAAVELAVQFQEVLPS
ncbi:NFX1-type zinc finger-containing protein [Nesidiocoris tenuis]|uniref:NFX1-type zinc finger-containing protein n=1 Tax=Nesidiocoris tenuis TaxID=355587 RepID=A0ABN7B909_9HEMI|nr:NFX1-type zinc finger-containing protein [Nesidiocoris tenuis]